jgi:hypothetical protein
MESDAVTDVHAHFYEPAYNESWRPRKPLR